MPRPLYIPRFTGRPYGGGGFGERRVHRRLRGMGRMSETRRGYFEDPAFNPSRIDFIGGNLPVELVAEQDIFGNTAAIIAGNGGILRFSTPDQSSMWVHTGSLSMNRTFNPRCEVRIKLGQTANHIARVGFADGLGATDALFFRHQPSVSANWIAVNHSNGVETTADTGVSATTDWTEMEIEVDDNAGIAMFSVADADLTMIERAALTTITSASLEPVYMFLQNVPTGTRTMDVDYFRVFHRRATI